MLRRASAILLIPLILTSAAAETVVLDTSGYWRVHTTLRPPVVRMKGQLKPLKIACRTALPPRDWMLGEFLDADWNRLPGAPFASHNSWTVVSKHNVGFVGTEQCSTCLSLIALRGKFKVTDPKRVKELTLNVAYRGGAVAYFNGVEIARGHLKPNATASDLAEAYPIDAFVKPDGSLLDSGRGKPPKEIIARWESRTRRLTDITVPSRLVRKGTNVVAIEIHRAPYHEVLHRKTRHLGRNARMFQYLWSTAGLVSARLTARSDDGLVPNVVRPKGFRVWNNATLMSDFDMDHGGSAEPLRPVRIVAARGGLFSGKVIAGSDAPIKGLRATATDLVEPDGGRISAKHIRIRYGLPTSYEPGTQRRYAAAATLLDGLTEMPPDEVPVREKEWVRGNWVRPGQPATRFGAVTSVWMTVSVPEDATPGEYKGALTVRAKGETPVKVPVALKLTAYVLPPADRFSTIVDFLQSPESVALKYKVPLWSDAHFKLLAESFKRLGEVGSRSIYIQLIARTNHGNEQSMVRWVKKPGGGYTHDFSVVERYVDVAMKHMGKPRMVVIYAWEPLLGAATRRNTTQGGEPPVTLVDPATGKTKMITLPPFRDKKSKAMWQALAAGLTKRLKARGLAGAMMLGVAPDSQPNKTVVALMKACFSGVPWMRQAHSRRQDFYGVPLAYQCMVWTSSFVPNADAPPKRGWNNEAHWTQFCRSRAVYPVTMARLLGEMNIQGSQRGFGRIGLDFWPVLEAKSGRRKRRFSIQARYPESNWRNLDWMIHDFVPPGPEGALSTMRLLMMREGIQECEARILIERALTTPTLKAKLGDELAKRCEAIIRERTRTVTTALENHTHCGFGGTSTTGHDWWSSPGQVGALWYVSSGWQKRSEELYTTAAEVARIIGKN